MGRECDRARASLHKEKTPSDPSQDLDVVPATVHEDEQIARVRIVLREHFLYEREQAMERLPHVGGFYIRKDLARGRGAEHALRRPAKNDTTRKDHLELASRGHGS